jgi:hypothetical protein
MDRDDRGNSDSYLLRVLVSIDQLGNVIAGGHPDVTVSARTGYFANVKRTHLRPWWLCMESIIDFAFKPVDGPGHCYEAYLSDKGEKQREGSDIARAILGIFVVVACIPISFLTRIWVVLVPGSSYKSNCEKST